MIWRQQAHFKVKSDKWLFIINEGKGFLSKTGMFLFKWHQGEWEKCTADIPRNAALRWGKRGWTKGCEVCQSYHGWKSSLLCFTCVIWAWTCIKNYVLLIFPQCEWRWSEICAPMVSQEWNMKCHCALSGLSWDCPWQCINKNLQSMLNQNNGSQKPTVMFPPNWQSRSAQIKDRVNSVKWDIVR